MAKKTKITKRTGCHGCGSKTEDLRFGWCYPCVKKAEARQKRKKKK